MPSKPTAAPPSPSPAAAAAATSPSAPAAVAPAATPGPVLAGYNFAAGSAPKPPQGKTAESRAGAVRQQQKGRVQYDYYSYNLDEGDALAADAPQQTQTQAQQQAQAQAGASGFKLCGVVENFSGGVWTLEERRQVLQLMGRKRMSHYLYAPPDRLHASHGWNWRAATPLDVTDLPALGAACAQQHVALNYAVPLGALFDFAAEQTRTHVAAHCLAAVRAGVRHLTLWFDAALGASEDQIRVDISGAKKNVGLVHADVCNRIFEAVRKGVDAAVAGTLCFYVSSAHTAGAFELEEALPKRKLYYWRDINTALAADVRLLLSAGEPVSRSISSAAAEGMRALFGPKRTLILLDHYPANDYCPHVTFLHPYDGRDVGLEKHLDGLLCTPARDVNVSLLPLATAFDYMRSTTRYEPLLALRDALSAVLPDERLQADMLELIGLSPAPIASTLTDATNKASSEQHFSQLRQKIVRVRAALPSALAADLTQFFVLLDAYAESNLRELALKSLRASKPPKAKGKPADDDAYTARVAQAEKDVAAAKRTFEELLQPAGTAPAAGITLPAPARPTPAAPAPVATITSPAASPSAKVAAKSPNKK